MGHRVVRFRQADFFIRPIDVFPRHHERADAGDIRLEGQRLQIEHQFGVFPEGLRFARGTSRHGDVPASTRQNQPPETLLPRQATIH
jgi:hypothetical protein